MPELNFIGVTLHSTQEGMDTLQLLSLVWVFTIKTLVQGEGEVSKENHLKFPWGVNFKFTGALHHSVDRVWVVTKVPIPKLQNVLPEPFDKTKVCQHHWTPSKWSQTRENRAKLHRKQQLCSTTQPVLNMIVLKEAHYHRRITALMTEELNKIIPPWKKRHKRGLMAAIPILSNLAMFAFEQLSSYLKGKRDRAMANALVALNQDQVVQRNYIKQLESDFLMYGTYNVESLAAVQKTMTGLHTHQSELASFVTNHSRNWSFYAQEGGDTLYSIQLAMYLHLVKEKHGAIYRELITSLKEMLNAVATLSRGYLPAEIFTPKRLTNITQEVALMLSKHHPEYGLALNHLSDYYDMKMVTFGIAPDHSMIITFPVLVKHNNRQRLDLYEVETVPVPVQDLNKELSTYTEAVIPKPYLAVSPAYYIELRIQELRMCKVIHYEYYCEEIFLVKHKTKFSCASALFHDLSLDTVMELCDFRVLYNATVPPSVLDGGPYVVLANMAREKKLLCKENSDLAVPLPQHNYVLMNRTVLCQCDIDAGLSYVLQNIGSCEEDLAPLTLYFTYNFAFYGAFTELLDNLSFVPPTNPQEEPVFPLALPVLPALLHTASLPLDTMETLVSKRLASFKNKGRTQGQPTLETKLFDSVPMKIFKFIMACLTGMCLIWLAWLALKHSKMKTYIAGLSLGTLPRVTSLPLDSGESDISDIFPTRLVCQDPWVSIVLTTLTVLGMAIYLYKECKGYALKKGILYSNKCTVYMFIALEAHYVPVKILETTGVMSRYKMTNKLGPNHIKLTPKCIWDKMTIEWKQVKIIQNSRMMILPTEVEVSIFHKLALRRMVTQTPEVYLMVKQGTNWCRMQTSNDCDSSVPDGSKESDKTWGSNPNLGRISPRGGSVSA